MPSTPTSFDEVLDAVEHLPPDQQADLVEVVRKRLAERGRQQVIVDATEARQQFKDELATPASLDNLMREINE